MDVREQYFNWMYDMVFTKRAPSYVRLLRYLNSQEFTYNIRLDGNRADDGLYLRYRFKQEKHLRAVDVDRCLTGKCSVLEMMVALCLRIEEDIMDDPVKGNRIHKWFHVMLKSLGLLDMDDAYFDERYADKVITRFLNREYEPNGAGGLFRIKNCPYDLRSVEIWYQMCWYFDSIL